MQQHAGSWQKDQVGFKGVQRIFKIFKIFKHYGIQPGGEGKKKRKEDVEMYLPHRLPF